ARGTIEHLLRASADFLTQEKNPPGCLMVRGALSCSEAADAIREELANRRNAGEGLIRERVERAKAEGELAPDVNAADVSCYVMTVMEGMSVRATGGANRAELHKVADMALRTLPV